MTPPQPAPYRAHRPRTTMHSYVVKAFHNETGAYEVFLVPEDRLYAFTDSLDESGYTHTLKRVS